MKQATKYKWGIGLSLFAAFAYVLVPVDVVPDAAPVLGWIDDIIAILLAVGNAVRLGAKIKGQ